MTKKQSQQIKELKKLKYRNLYKRMSIQKCNKMSLLNKLKKKAQEDTKERIALTLDKKLIKKLEDLSHELEKSISYVVGKILDDVINEPNMEEHKEAIDNST